MLPNIFFAYYYYYTILKIELLFFIALILGLEVSKIKEI